MHTGALVYLGLGVPGIVQSTIVLGVQMFGECFSFVSATVEYTLYDIQVKSVLRVKHEQKELSQQTINLLY